MSESNGNGLVWFKTLAKGELREGRVSTVECGHKQICLTS